MENEIFDTKLYELIGMSSGRFETKYYGIRLTLKFEQGFSNTGIQVGQLITNDKFMQDAIEHDVRYGRRWRLKQVFERPKEEPKQEEVVEEQQPVVRRSTLPKREPKPKTVDSPTQDWGQTQKKKAKKEEKNEDKLQTSRTVVETITTMNEAATWFAAKGEEFTNEGELKQLMEKFNVDFPNLHL